MKNLLMICYLFPPLGGSGALRPLKLAKYLPGFGWRPIILTVKNPDWYYAQDFELLDELPGEARIFRGRMFKASWFYRLLNPFRNPRLERFIKTCILHPDPQVGWIPGAYVTAFNIINRIPIHAVYSTSGPLTSHLIAYLVKQRFNLPWVAEFRDEWFEAPDTPMPTKLHERLHFQLEGKIVNSADAIITMAPHFSKLLIKHTRKNEKFTTLTAGIDTQDYCDHSNPSGINSNSDIFETIYSGVFYNTFPPNIFITAVNELIDEGAVQRQHIKISFVGPNSRRDLNVEDRYQICHFTGFLPRKQAIERTSQADLLLLLLSEERGAGVIPSKIFEYMASRRPILALVPRNGAVSELIRRTGTGTVIDFTDSVGIKKSYKRYYDNWLHGHQHEPVISTANFAAYDQKQITGRLAGILKKITPRTSRPFDSG